MLSPIVSAILVAIVLLLLIIIQNLYQIILKLIDIKGELIELNSSMRPVKSVSMITLDKFYKNK